MFFLEGVWPWVVQGKPCQRPGTRGFRLEGRVACARCFSHAFSLQVANHLPPFLHGEGMSARLAERGTHWSFLSTVLAMCQDQWTG